MRKLMIAVAALLAAVALAACGGDDSSKSDDFATDYKPLNAKLLGVGRELADTIQGASKQSNTALAGEFNDLAKDLKRVGGDIEKLDPPDDLKADVEDLTSAIDEVDGSLAEIADAANRNDAAGARKATATMIKQSQDLNQAQNKVAAATGAAKGSS